MPAPTEMTVAQLARLVGTPDAPLLLDLRIDEDVQDSHRSLPCARRVDATTVSALSPTLAGRRVVAICHRGRKLSHGAAAVLRAEGVACEVLQGGHVAWEEAGRPTVDLAALPARDEAGRTVWVTRQRPKIDRIACPWLIRRFIDPDARFLFVPPEDVALVADRFGATPFDVEGLGLEHDGEFCTFDTMLRAFGLRDPALDAMATIVRAADTDRHDLAPQAAGLLALSVGLSRMYRDDLAQLEAGMGLYDALYRWARDGQDEGHDWPAGRA